MRDFLLVMLAISVLGVSAILVVGYPGDGRKGYPTAFGRYERGTRVGR